MDRHLLLLVGYVFTVRTLKQNMLPAYVLSRVIKQFEGMNELCGLVRIGTDGTLDRGACDVAGIADPKSRPCGFEVWKVMHWKGIECSQYAFERRWVVNVSYVVIPLFIFREAIEGHLELLNSEINNAIKVFQLLESRSLGLFLQEASLLTVLGRNCPDCYAECKCRACRLCPAGCARVLLEPNNQPFHSAPLQFLNRIAMVHDLRGGANV